MAGLLHVSFRERWGVRTEAIVAEAIFFHGDPVIMDPINGGVFMEFQAAGDRDYR
jgi:hypothetical protein